MLTYVFPGQGSQEIGMGSTLFDEFVELTMEADKILGYSIKELCLQDPYSQLGQTQYTQPALYVVNALSYLKTIKDTGRKPDYVAGHSLGEYNALFAAGVYDFATGLELVKERGRLMSQAQGGKMAAIIGLSEQEIINELKNNGLESINIANYNTPTQIVISGPKEEIDLAQPIFEKVPKLRLYAPLKVSGAFHSQYMSKAKEQFERHLNSVKLNPIKIPVISNVKARPYKQDEIKVTLASQIDSPVKWTESIRYLMGCGEMDFKEIGPGKVLQNMIRRIQREAEPLIIEEDLVTPYSLGSKAFKDNYSLKYAYIAGGMYRGIASKELVVKMGKAGMMGFLGTGGMKHNKIEQDITYIKRELTNGQAYGLNIVHNFNNAEQEERLIDLFLENDIKVIEAAAFLNVTPSLVRYKAKGIRKDNQGNLITNNKIIAKISRPEVAEGFMSPASDFIISKLLKEDKITLKEAEYLKNVPVADDICVESDSGGHTDGGNPCALIPAMIKLRDDMMKKYSYDNKIHVGAAGGIGTSEASAAAFMLGADFIVTGSINQCSVEAAISDSAKDLLQQANVQDTAYVPAGDMFEIGAKVQVLRKGLFFPARANKLYSIYQQYNSIEEIDDNLRKQIQEKYFRKSFADVFEEVKDYYPPKEIKKAEENKKHKMALIFKWYFGHSTQMALKGCEDCKVDYQINCGPALGAFNQWIKGTEIENWRNRHVDEIGEKIMKETADYFNKRISEVSSN